MNLLVKGLEAAFSSLPWLYIYCTLCLCCWSRCQAPDQQDELTLGDMTEMPCRP
uniref:Uncharacterized protein n=1 Tax=Anguilla anguilla TaxID=7936 RepID=A0A0E9VDP6_ANGAN